jgi:serine/threonine protein kinase
LAEIAQIFLRCLLAVHYLHGRGIIHGDISAHNILFHNDLPVLIDFGASEILTPGAVGLSKIGTPPFAAPERELGKSSPAVDIYSLGATVTYLIEGNLSFRKELGLWEGAPPSLHRLIGRMMDETAGNRPSAKVCIDDGFFREILGEDGVEFELRGNPEFAS